MKFFKKRDKPKKAKRKLSVVVTVLLCIASIGLCFSLSSFAVASVSGSGDTLSPPQLKPPESNNSPSSPDNSESQVDAQAIQITNIRKHTGIRPYIEIYNHIIDFIKRNFFGIFCRLFYHHNRKLNYGVLNAFDIGI